MNQLKKLSVVAVALALGISTQLVLAASAAPDALKTQAKVTETDARATALVKVPGGTVQSGELEQEHGKLIWSFDILDSKSPNIVEVQVDAKTGQVISAKIESVAEQAKEAKADRRAKP